MKKRYINYINNNFSRLDGKTVVITGGTGGIGFHISKYLAYLGANVILAARNKMKTDKVIEEITNLIPNAKLEYRYLDLTDNESVTNFINYLDTINVDYLFLNSGIYNQELKTINNMDIHYLVNYYKSDIPYRLFLFQKDIQHKKLLYPNAYAYLAQSMLFY